MYEEYLEFGGTEIANAERVVKYVQKNAPHIPLRKRRFSPTLHEALGEADYESPLVDNAPWLDPSNPATAKFYGVYPLSVSGMEGSTREADVTETIAGGASIGRERHGSRAIRVKALLVAENEQALAAGQTWLNSALQPSNCDDHGGSCGGGKLCYYSAEPPVCDEWEPTFEVGFSAPVLSADAGSGITVVRLPEGDDMWKANLEDEYNPHTSQADGAVIRWGAVSRDNTSLELESYGPIVRQRTNLFEQPNFLAPTVRTFWPGDETDIATNIVTNPSMESVNGTVELRRNLAVDPRATSAPSSDGTLRWRTSRWFGSAPAAGTHETITDATDGPTLWDGSKITSYLRKTWTAAPPSMGATGDTGFDVTPAGVDAVPIVAGQVVLLGGFLRPSIRRNLKAAFQFYDAAGVALGARVTGLTTFSPANEWTWVEHAAVAPASAAFVSLILDSSPEATDDAEIWGPGDTLDGTGLLVEVRPGTQGLTVPPYVDGHMVLDGGRTAAWAGAVDASATIVTAPNVRDIGSGADGSDQRFSYQSPDAAYEGDFGLRVQIRRPEAVGVQLAVSNPSVGAPATIVFMARSNDRTLSITPRIRGANGTAVELPVGEWTEVRATVLTGGASNASTGFVIASGAGHQVDDTIDVDLATIVVVPDVGSPYTGPPFSGSSDPSGGNTMYRWSGAENLSTSIATLVSYVIIGEGEDGPDGRAYAHVPVAGGVALLEQDSSRAVTPPSGPLILSMDMRAPVSTEVTVELRAPDTNAVLRTATFVVTDVWRRYSFPMLTTANFYLRYSAAAAFQITGIGVEVGNLEMPYLDGNQLWQDAARGYITGAFDPEYSIEWLGTPNDSRSRLRWLGELTVGQQLGSEYGGGVCNAWPFVEMLQGEISGGRSSFSMRRKVPTETQVEPYERTMHDVRCIEGPTPIEELTLKTAGAMRIVEFILVAGNPWAYSPTQTLIQPTAMSTLPTFSWPGVDDCPVTTPTAIFDPDCVVPPAPPRPPEIVTACVVPTETVQRYWFGIPASSVSVWSDMVPRMRIYSGANEIRQVRVRAFPNPFDRTSPSSEFPLDPCSWCAEFVVSYLPANTELTVDAILERAFATVANQAPQPADHLLYASDNGPMTWPALSCGIGYIFTVDVPDLLLDDVTIAFELARRE